MSMSNISNKWKRFAIEQVLSDWGNIAPDDLFDLIVDTENDNLVVLFSDYDVSVWQPFEDWHLSNVADHIVEMATRAQQCEYLS